MPLSPYFSLTGLPGDTNFPPPSLLLRRNLLSLGQLTLILELHTSIKRGDRDRLFTTGRLLIGVSSKSSPLQANEEKAAFPPKTPSSLQPSWHPSSGHLLSLSTMSNHGNKHTVRDAVRSLSQVQVDDSQCSSLTHRTFRLIIRRR